MGLREDEERVDKTRTWGGEVSVQLEILNDVFYSLCMYVYA